MTEESREIKFSDSDFLFEEGDIGISKSECDLC